MSHHAVADVTRNGEPAVVVHANCDMCGALFILEISETEWLTWRAGASIQNAIPGLSADERELLISGTCGKCFDELFGERA